MVLHYAITVVLFSLDIRRHEGLGEPTVADAICDRLLAGAHRIELSGASLRRTETRPDHPSGTDTTTAER